MSANVARIQDKALQKQNSGFSSLSEKELEVIQKQFFPQGASKEDIGYCLSVAKQLDLNPLMKEIMFVPRKQQINGRWVEKYEPLVGRDGFLSIAHKTGQLAGIETESTLKEIPVLTNKGWEYKKELVARCTVYRKDTDKPFVVEVSFNEYAQRTKEGYLTAFWRDKPETMLKKVAESQCLRKAFNISGIYAAEEVGYGTYKQDGSLAYDIDAEINSRSINDNEQPENKPTPTDTNQKTEQPDDLKKYLEQYLKKQGFNVATGNDGLLYVQGSALKPGSKRILDIYFKKVPGRKDVYVQAK